MRCDPPLRRGNVLKSPYDDLNRLIVPLSPWHIHIRMCQIPTPTHGELLFHAGVEIFFRHYD